MFKILRDEGQYREGMNGSNLGGSIEGIGVCTDLVSFNAVRMPCRHSR